MPHRWKVLTLVSVGVFMVSLDLFIVNVAFPSIERDFHGSSVSSVSWVLNAYAIVVAALMVSAGRFADRHGRKRLFQLGMLIFVIGSALCGAAWSVPTLVIARIIQGSGAALMLPTSLALLLPEFSPAERPAAIGIWAAIGGVAAAFGPPIGGLLVHISWRLVFFVNLPVGIGALLYGTRLLHESRDQRQERPDLLGSALIAAAIGLLALGLVEAPTWGWGNTRTIAVLAASGVGVGAFWARCLTHPSPVIDPAIVRVRSFALANLSSIIFSAAFSAFLLSNVLLLTGVWHESIVIAGLQLAPGPATAATVAAISGRHLNRFGQRTFATIGITLFGLGALWWRLRIGATPDYAGEMLPGQFITGSGVGFVLPSLASASASSLPPARFATGSGVYAMTRQIGFAIGISVLIAVLGRPDRVDPVRPFDRGYLFMMIACSLAALAALAIGRIRAGAAHVDEAVASPAPPLAGAAG
jgi:EmrB/QacA subfamily drug resistance transporter